MEVVKGIILKIQDYTENQRIIHLFSREKGYMSFISPTYLFRRNNSYKANYMQITEAEYYENPRGGLYKLKTLTPIVNNSGIYLDIYKMNVALLWSEVLNLLLKREQKNENLFDFIRRSIEYLHSTRGDVANFNLFFLYRLVTLIGFRINTETYSEGFVFNINDGNFVAAGTPVPYISGPNAARMVYTLSTCRVDELKALVLDRKSRSILLDIVLLFFSIHLNVDFNVKSIKVLRDIFNE